MNNVAKQILIAIFLLGIRAVGHRELRVG